MHAPILSYIFVSLYKPVNGKQLYLFGAWGEQYRGLDKERAQRHGNGFYKFRTVLYHARLKALRYCQYKDYDFP